MSVAVTHVPEGVVRPTESTRTIVTIDDSDQRVAARVRGLLDREDLVHVATRGPRLDAKTASGASLILVVVGSAIDWAGLSALAHGCDTVVLSRETSRSQARRALSVGAIGYLPLTLTDAALRAALFAVLSGEAAYSRAILGEWLRSRKHTLISEAPADLTARQRQILERIAHGDTDKEIAGRLGIAVATAHKHVQNLLRRLGVPNRAAAVTRANGFLDGHGDLGESP
jgi:DNA-binding NarL/FixJ family response regulator